MRYYLIVGEASGDLHASELMRQILCDDPAAEFRFFGGDRMAAVGGTLVRHYKEIAYMGFLPVLLHLRTILRARQECKADILAWRPDKIILVDYAGFNLHIAKWAKSVARDFTPEIVYYILPKLWAWKARRIKYFRRYVDRALSILPFEAEWFAERGVRVEYVGNPTAKEVATFLAGKGLASVADRGSLPGAVAEAFRQRYALDARPIVALLPGSRRQEVRDNLRMMLRVSRHFADYQFVIAGVPTVDKALYE